MSLFNDFIHKFPDSINARFGTNLQKMIRFVSESFDEINALHQTIEDYRDIDKAKGKALDRLGAKYAQERGKADDDFYRIMIKSKVMVRNGDVTVNGILRVIQNSMGVPVDGIKIENLRSKPTDNAEPLAIRINNIPLDVAKTDWEQAYLLKRIQSDVAVGIRIQNILFHGSSTADIYLGHTSKAMIKVVIPMEVDTTYYHEQSESIAETGQLVKTSVTYRI